MRFVDVNPVTMILTTGIGCYTLRPPSLFAPELTHKRLPIYSYLVSSFLIPSCSLLDFVAETYPTRPWTYKDMMQAINKGFIDYRNHPPKGPQN